MNLLSSQTEPLPGESVVKEISTIASKALENMKLSTIKTFHLLWDDESSRASKLERMVTNAVIGFEQHYDTVLYLLRSYGRSFLREVEITNDEFASFLSNPIVFIMTNPSHPMTSKLLSEMSISDFVPPQQYKPNDDGTITLN